MSFAGPAEHYDRFMGRYTPSLAVALADAAGVVPGQHVCDVGCGPGGLTRELVTRVGAGNVAAIDPAHRFAVACRERNPGVDVREGVAEELPWPDGAFDTTLSSLVIGFMNDPDGGVREMARVTRPGGAVASCMWDVVGGRMTMLRVFWTAVRQVDPAIIGETRMAGTSEGDIAARFRRAGLLAVVDGTITAEASYVDFDDFWEPFAYGVGPAGQSFVALPEKDKARVRELCREALPLGAFTLDAHAWYARGTVPPT
ncbi:methyltransferase family protein [Rhodococcus sp. SMB37]|uniref:class I SAM-dependent methyltransferase n=1 Tax=Rhodococcus sp. SMB37 TaxID=2512213 RepID=UPI001048AB89|nr:class I SAM-dependent methyltransferase [Rhodococcus sp. SMB37]TCN58425.1 methyltransferase family protein [Rhodococcus sp. SMB37]